MTIKVAQNIVFFHIAQPIQGQNSNEHMTLFTGPDLLTWGPGGQSFLGAFSQETF